MPPADKRHRCLATVDAELAKHNTRLVANLFNWNDVFIETERIKRLRDGKRAKRVVAACCPFCGKKLVRKEKF